MHKHLIISFAFLSWVQLPIIAQNSFEPLINRIDSVLQLQKEKYPDEHILIVTDKNEYLAGETVWLSFFVNTGSEPSYISKTIYAEIVSPAGVVVVKKMLPVENGFSHGDILIPAAAASGAYILNVYSNWMRNFRPAVSSQYLFVSGNDYSGKPFLFSFNDKKVTSAEIIPEGGSFIPGQPCNFIVSLKGENNLPVQDSFIISENDNPIMSEIAINGLAQVSFAFTPGKKYKISSGVFSREFDFNKIIGVQLQVNSTGKTRFFFTLDKAVGYQSEKFLLAGIRYGEICLQSVFSFSDGITTIPVLRNKLPSGVIDFFVFDENESIVAFRRVYNPPAPANLIKQTFAEGKNEVSFSTSVKSGTIFVTAENNSTIKTTDLEEYNILLSEKNLQGESSHFIQYSDAEAQLNRIDQLLCMQTTMLHGGKFELQDHSLKYIAESGITISGNVAPYAGSKSDKGYHVELFVRGEDSSRIMSRANALPDGNFMVNDFGFRKEATVYFQGHNPKNQNELLQVKIFPSYFDTLKRSHYLPGTVFPKIPVTKSVNPVLIRKMDSLMALDPQYKTLEEVVVKTKVKTKLDTLRQDYLSPIFDDGNAQIFIPEGHRFISIWHYLRAYVPGLTIVGDLLNPEDVTFSRYTLLPRVNNTGEDVQMDNPDGIYFFLNEIQVRSDVISSINLEDVALITVTKQPVPALGAYNGYISVYTKKGASFDAGLSKKLSSVKVSGYSVTRNSFIASDWRPVTSSTIIAQVITKDSKPLVLKLSPEQTYKIIIAGRDEKGNFILDEKIIRKTK